MLSNFTATATTCDISLGEEQVEDGMLRIRNRVFTDVVESDDPRIAGTNRPTLDIDLDPSRGEGDVRGRFVMTPKAGGGTWEGELHGRISGGLVTAFGLAQGTGPLGDAVLRVDFQQVERLPATPPCASPKAFFEMAGSIYRRE